jgi:transcriptional regulator with XRE-family HTH domain
MDNFSVWVLGKLDKKGWTSATLARQAGIHPGGLSHILNGNRNPTAKTISAIAQALDVPPEIALRKAGILPAKSDAAEQLF